MKKKIEEFTEDELVRLLKIWLESHRKTKQSEYESALLEQAIRRLESTK